VRVLLPFLPLTYYIVISLYSFPSPSLSLSQMYSGIFTHCIKPVLSTTQIGKLFGLLGYQPGLGQQEQLLRGRTGVHSTPPGRLLQLACGFFLARCECQLLLAALGNRGGEVEWELGLVMERRRGHSLQVCPSHELIVLITFSCSPIILFFCAVFICCERIYC